MKLFGFFLYFAFCFKFYALETDESFNLSNLGLGKRHFNRVWCLNDEFTCSSTKCVPDSVLCDGIHDCDDGSDEDPDLCKSLNPRSCKLPPITEDSSYIVNCEEDVPIHSGDYVPEMSLLSFVCKPGYVKNSGNQFQSFCLNNTWIPAIHSCSRVCKKLQIPNLSYHCYQNDEQVQCTDELSHGTKIKLSCPPYHYPTHEEIVCNENGEWDVKHIKCVAECGKYYPEAENLLNGKDYPWHVSVKRKNPSGSTYVFSGTLISPNLVMTVARSEASHSGDKMQAKGFEVVVNNYLDAEYRDVYKVQNIFFSPKGFSPQSNLADEPNDIALLLLENKVNISSTVLPICMDWTRTHVPSETKILRGKIARFGDAKETISPLKEEIYILDADSYDYETCLDKVPSSNIQYDQFCGSVTDGNETGRSDYGTGYYIEEPNDHLYYMVGVYRANYASQGVKVFTNVSTHFDWLKSTHDDVEKWFESKELIVSSTKNGDCDEIGNCKLEHTSFKPLYYNSLMLSCKGKKLDVQFTNGCTLPFTNATNYKYHVACPFNLHNDIESFCKRSKEGTHVPEYTTITTHCECGYTSLQNKEGSVCFQGNWLPEPQPCQKACKKLKLKGVETTCTYESKVIKCNESLISGVILHQECMAGHAPENMVKNRDLICDEEGEWSGQILKCVPVCGLSKHSLEHLIEPKISEVGDFPWHVAIYDKVNNHDLICAGTILTADVILTAADCFVDANLKKRNASEFVIAVAKTNKIYKVADSPHTQYHEVESIILKNYYGQIWKYFNDVALIQIKTKITFGTEVSPACMQFDKNLPSGHTLKTAGWKDGLDLKISELPYISFPECINEAPSSVKEYVLEDKFCAGKYEEIIQNSAISGSGIYYYDVNSSSYHVVGVASSKLPDFPHVSLFTNANYHGPWIRTTHHSLLKTKKSN